MCRRTSFYGGFRHSAPTRWTNHRAETPQIHKRWLMPQRGAHSEATCHSTRCYSVTLPEGIPKSISFPLYFILLHCAHLLCVFIHCWDAEEQGKHWASSLPTTEHWSLWLGIYFSPQFWVQPWKVQLWVEGRGLGGEEGGETEVICKRKNII